VENGMRDRLSASAETAFFIRALYRDEFHDAQGGASSIIRFFGTQRKKCLPRHRAKKPRGKVLAIKGLASPSEEIAPYIAICIRIVNYNLFGTIR
jgi:hypothetical protein